MEGCAGVKIFQSSITSCLGQMVLGRAVQHTQIQVAESKHADTGIPTNPGTGINTSTNPGTNISTDTNTGTGTILGTNINIRSGIALGTR
ncbi:hypothetical protein WISP_51557 [Willisornis vidua]|uniref:Uncharacterized protein n=1 Tax=Willisornis vidua TaxID=1566151 RepID=A0ABQ9DEW8_9PASS|nr:hypothetical protein WISP_51557 [Willisornis vidua]